MTLRRWLLLALLTATVLGVGFVIFVVRMAVVAADALAHVLVQFGFLFTMLVAIPYALAYCIQLLHLAWIANLPLVLLIIFERWTFLGDWWKWLMGG